MSEAEMPPQMVRSIQQSLRAEGYDVTYEEVNEGILRTLRQAYVLSEAPKFQPPTDSELTGT